MTDTPSAVAQATPISLDLGRTDDHEELARAELYGLLARLWLAPPDAELLQQFKVAVTEAEFAGAALAAPWHDLVAALREQSDDKASKPMDEPLAGPLSPRSNYSKDPPRPVSNVKNLPWVKETFGV